jgi:cyclase
LPAIKVYCTRDVDELILLDINATSDCRQPDFESIEEFSAECFVPLTVGGGIREIDDITRLLRAGADKITINSAAYSDPDFVRRAATRFGSQCIVISIDVRRRADGNYECFSHCGSVATGKTPVEWVRELESLGAGEVLLTSVERDGTMSGYDLDLVRSVTQAVNIPVIAAGGAGNYEHLYEVISAGHANAVAAASMFHFTEQTPLAAKQFLAGKGLSIRRGRIGSGR